MLFSATTEYAIRGLSELAKRPPEQFVMLDELVLGTDLPRGFLAKVFQVLVKGGILRSHKGRGGGFMLARVPGQITLMQVVEVVEGRSLLGLPLAAEAAVVAPVSGLYGAVGKRLEEYLGRTTLADVLEAERRVKREQERALRRKNIKRPRVVR